jgi:hypothetical protein
VAVVADGIGVVHSRTGTWDVLCTMRTGLIVLGMFVMTVCVLGYTG